MCIQDEDTAAPVAYEGSAVTLEVDKPNNWQEPKPLLLSSEGAPPARSFRGIERVEKALTSVAPARGSSHYPPQACTSTSLIARVISKAPLRDASNTSLGASLATD